MKIKLFDSIAKQASKIESNPIALMKRLKAVGSSLVSIPSIIASDMMVEGQLVATGAIEIEGRVKGTLKCHSIVIRDGGIVEGNILADSLSVKGEVSGSARAKNITILANAKFQGEVEYETLSVEDGACIDASFKRIEIEPLF